MVLQSVFRHLKPVFKCLNPLFALSVLAIGAAAGQTVMPGSTAVTFSAANVGVAPGSAETKNVTFTLAGFSSVIAPTATMHYGLSYKAGDVTCTGSLGSQTCSVPVTFLPQYPGGRKDAVFLMNGTTRLGTGLVYGIGNAPFAMVQPGVVTSPITSSSTYLYDSEVDENGTVYVLESEGNAVVSVTAAGVVTTLPITSLNSPRGLGIDGAGVLYIADQKPNSSLTTYDTVQGTQGAIPYPSGAFYVQNVITGNEGNLYATDSANIYTIAPDGTTTSTPISPANTQATQLAVDSNEDLFIGGYEINEIPFSGTQSQINTNGAGDGLGVDAALTLYGSRYSAFGSASVAELAAADYTTALAELDPSASPLGSSVGPDGTVWVGNYTNLDKVDRTQGAVDFGEQSQGTASSPQTIQIYNGGNKALTISSIALTGDTSFTIQTGAGTTCSTTGTVAPGALCTIALIITPPHAGTFSGTLTITSNSLNASGSIATVTLSGFVYGVYVTAAPNPLNFGNQAQGTTSGTKTVTLTNNGDLYSAGIGQPTSSDPDFTVTAGTCTTGVNVGSSCALNVTFTPAAAASYSSTVTISVGSSGGGANQTTTFTANGTGIGSVTASPTSLNMGSETEYTENYTPQYITLTNNSGSTVTFSNFQSADVQEFYSQAYTCSDSGILDSGNSCELSVRFSPLSVGTITSSITMPYTGGGGGTLVVDLTGTGTAGTPAIDLYPLPIVFGTLPVMTAATAVTVQVEATGTAPLTGITASIAGADAADYTQTNTCAGVTIDPYPGTGSCNITVSFTPTAGGARSATLNVSSNGGGATFSTPLTGAGIANQAQVQFTPTQLNLFAGAAGTCGDTTAGGPATSATLCNINSAAQDYLGNTYLVDTNYNVVYKVDTTGAISVFAGTPSTTGGFSGDGGLATSATLQGPKAVAADAFGNVYISDTGNGAIREVVASTGDIDTVITNGCDEGVSKPKSLRHDGMKPRQISGDACLPTFQPEGLVFDRTGNLFFADTADNYLMEALAGGNLKLIAGSASSQGGGGTAGYTGDNGPATAATLNGPQDVAVDTLGNVYIADTKNHVIRIVTASTGNIATFAGTGTSGDTGDAGAATSAEITAYGVSANLAGDIFIAAGSGGVVRKVDASGNITTFAGGGTGALSGPASSGAIANAYFVRADNAGDLLIPTGLQVLAAGPDGLLQFGSETIGSTTAALTTTVESTGDSNLSVTSTGTSITGTNAGDFAVSGSTCGNSEAPGKTCGISVTFKPTASGTRSATLQVGTNATGSPQMVLLQGTGTVATAPTASLSPTTLSFPNTATGSTATAMSTTLSNTGTATLNISGITLTGTGAADFAETTTCGSTLAAGSTCTISVTFSPAAAASYTASISVTDNATGSPQTVTLSGTGTTPPAPVASLSPTALSFPSTTAGTTSAALSTTLSNTGNAVLNISGITLAGTNPGDFAETTTCGTTLAAGSTCAISVTFTPAAAASYAATISVADNATGSPQTAALSGTGTAVPAPVASLTPTSLNFPNTVSGETAVAQTLMLSNTGNAVLTISGISLGGTNPADFAETTTCGATLAAAASCTIAVTFTPASVAGFSATISVADNAAGSPQTSTLSGTGVNPPDFTVSSTTPSQTIQSGGSAQYPIVIAATNGDFTGTVTLTATGLPPGATASFSPATVSPGDGSVSSVLSVQTGTSQARVRERWPWLPVSALAFCVPVLWWRRRSRGRMLGLGLMCALLSVTAMFVTGCGGGYYLDTSKTYTITVTGTSGSSQHSTTVTLTIE